MQLIISIVTPFDFPRQVEYSCVISLSAASLPRHATIPNAISPTVFMRGRRRARTSDHMTRSPPPRWDTIVDRIASDPCAERNVMEYWHGVRGSVRLRPREFHHLCPLLGFVSDELAEFGRQHRHRLAAQIGEPRLDPVGGGTPSARSLPARIYPVEPTAGGEATRTFPPSQSVSAGPPARHGTRSVTSPSARS